MEHVGVATLTVGAAEAAALKEGMAAVLSSHKGGGLLPRRAHGRE